MQNMSGPGNHHSVFQLNHSVRKKKGPWGIRASNAPSETPKTHESRPAIIAVLDSELLSKVAHAVFVVSTRRPDVIHPHPDLVHKAWVHRECPVDHAIARNRRVEIVEDQRKGVARWKILTAPRKASKQAIPLTQVCIQLDVELIAIDRTSVYVQG